MTELITQSELMQIKAIASDAYDSRLLSPEIRNAQAAFFVAAVGAELGLSPIQSLQNIYVIKGKAILSSHAILAIVMRRRDICKYFRLVESTAERATYETLRDGAPTPSQLTYTIDDAKRANLLNNPTWKNHPAAMLRASCGTSLARAVYPDLVLGVYDDYEAPEIRGEEPVIVSSVSAPAPQLPAAPETPHPAFAPTSSERVQELLSQIQQADSVAKLQEMAASFTREPEDVRAAIRDDYKAHAATLREVEAILSDARQEGADLEALRARAVKLPADLPSSLEAQLGAALKLS